MTLWWVDFFAGVSIGLPLAYVAYEVNKELNYSRRRKRKQSRRR